MYVNYLFIVVAMLCLIYFIIITIIYTGWINDNNNAFKSSNE